MEARRGISGDVWVAEGRFLTWRTGSSANLELDAILNGASLSPVLIQPGNLAEEVANDLLCGTTSHIIKANPRAVPPENKLVLCGTP